MQSQGCRRNVKLRQCLIVCLGVLAAIGLTGCEASLTGENAVASSEHQSETVTSVVTSQSPSADLLPDRINDEFLKAVIRLGETSQENGTAMQLFVDISITQGWHIYAADADYGPFSPTVVELKFPDGVEMSGEWIRPEATPLIGSGAMAEVYMGNVTFQANLKLSPTFLSNNQTIRCRLQYQACNEFRCCDSVTRDLTLGLDRKTLLQPEK